MKARYAILSCAFASLTDQFREYRKRVAEKEGKEAELAYYYGAEQELVASKIVDANGKEKEKKEHAMVVNGRKVSQYARYFDESCEQWTKSPEYNLTFVLGQQRVANEIFHTRGHMFLNEVYDMLGIPRTEEGQYVGWVEGNGDNYIDFNVFTGWERSRAFVNGYERVILLDFNVDGIIVDKI